MEPQDTPQGKAALQFAHALVAGNYAMAHSMLVYNLRADWSEAKLKAEFEEVIAYGDRPVNFVDVMQTLDDWPAREVGDIGWAYVAVAGADFSEAVAVVVAKEGGHSVIREIEWGRP